MDNLIDDEVRRSFPGFTDQQIIEFYDLAKSAEIIRTEIFDSDLSHARIIREIGWLGFKEYLRVSVGSDFLDADDIIALTNALIFIREIDNASSYSAIYGASSEATSKKTVSARKQSLKQLTSQLENFDVTRGI